MLCQCCSATAGCVNKEMLAKTLAKRTLTSQHYKKALPFGVCESTSEVFLPPSGQKLLNAD